MSTGPRPSRGLITQKYHGPEWRAKLKAAKERRRAGKPKTWQAIERSGLLLKEIYGRASVGKETMRKALYGHVGRRSARDIVSHLAPPSFCRDAFSCPSKR